MGVHFALLYHLENVALNCNCVEFSGKKLSILDFVIHPCFRVGGWGEGGELGHLRGKFPLHPPPPLGETLVNT